MGSREEKFSLIRGQLDSLGYNQVMSMESLHLVNALLSDLVLYKDRYSRYKDIAQNALQKNHNLQITIQPLHEENEHLKKENNFLHFELLQTREQFEKNLKSLRSHIADLESAYSDLEFANMELIAKIGALEEQLLCQNEKLSRYEGLPKNVTNVRPSRSHHAQSSGKENKKCGVFPSISAVNNYISDVLAQKNPIELAGEVEKLKAERKKLAESIDFYQRQVLSRDNEIKRLAEQSTIRNVPSSSSAPVCRCHFIQLDDDSLPASHFDICAKFDELSKKLQSSAERTVLLAEQVKAFESRLEETPQHTEQRCICRELARLQDLQRKCHCHNNYQKHYFPAEKSRKSGQNHKEGLSSLANTITSENDSLKKEIVYLKREIYDLRNKAFQSGTSANQELMDENINLSRDLSELAKELKSAQDENKALKESNSLLQKAAVELKENKKVTSDKSISVKEVENGVPKLSDRINKKDVPVQLKKSSCVHGRNEKTTKPVASSVPDDLTALKNGIIKEVESLWKQHILPATPQDEEKQIELRKELEAVKAERDYYCKEYHCLQDKIFSSQGQNVSPSPHYNQRWAKERLQCFDKMESNKNSENEIMSSSLQPLIDRLNRENGMYKDKINLLEEKIRVLEVEKGYQERGQENQPCKCSSRDVQQLASEVASLRKQIMELQHDLHYEKCENKVMRLKLEDSSKLLETESNKALIKTEELLSRIYSHENTIEMLNKKVKDLMSEKSCLQAQYFNLSSMTEHLERSLKNAEVMYHNCDKELIEALRRLKLVEEEKKEVVSELNRVRQEAEAAVEKVLRISKEKDQMLNELDAKTIQVDQLEKEKQQHYCLINQLEEKVSRLNCQLMRCNTEGSRAGNEITHLKRELEICNASNNKLQNQNRNLQSDLEALVKDNELKLAENEKYQQEILKLKEQLQNYVEEVRRVEQILEAKELEREDMLEQYKTLSAEAMQLENSNLTLESENQCTSNSLRAARDKLQALQASLHSKESLIANLQEQVMELSSHLYTLKDELKTVGDENTQLKEEIELSKEKMTSVDSTKRDYESQIIILQKHLDELKQSSGLMEGMTTVGATEEEHRQSRAADRGSTQQVNHLEAVITQLQQQLSAMSGTLHKYQEMCEEYKSKNLQLQREIINEKFEKVRAEETQETHESFSTSL